MGRINEVDRKRTRHQKTRTGCDKCKARRIKCPEGHPCRRCVIAKLDCTYSNVPKPNVLDLENGVERLGLFSEDGYDGSEDTDAPGLRRSSTDSTGYGQGAGHFYSTSNRNSYPTPRSCSSTSGDEASDFRELSRARRKTDLSLLKSPDAPLFVGSFETSAREYSLHWLTYYTSPRSVIPKHVWLQRIHQHAHHFSPIRNLIIAMGGLGLSIAQGHDEAAHHGVLQRVHKYTSDAIVDLGSAPTKIPTIVMLYCCWMFWQLDMIRGNLASSYLHVQSAHKIAAEAAAAGNPVDDDELGGLFGSSGPIFMIDVRLCPGAFSPSNSPFQRRKYALPLIMGTIRDLSEMILRVSTDVKIPADVRSEIVKILEGCRKDEEWLLFQWAGEVASAEAEGHSSSAGNSPESQRRGSGDQVESETIEVLQPWQMDLSDVVDLTEIAPLGSKRFQLRVQKLIPDHDIIVGCAAPTGVASSEYQSHPSIIDVYRKAFDLAASQGFTPEAVARFKMYALQFVVQISQLVGQDDLKMRVTLLRMLERQRIWQGS